MRPQCALRAGRAAREFGYTRMWSIHPSQIRPILEAFAPDAQAIETATKIIAAAARAALGAGRALAANCTTAPATATSGRCSSARMPTGRPLPAEARDWFS